MDDIFAIQLLFGCAFSGGKARFSPYPYRAKNLLANFVISSMGEQYKNQ